MKNFDKVYVINLPSRKDRLDSFWKRYNQLGVDWNIEIFSAICEEPKNPLYANKKAVWSCMMSHLSILKILEKSKYNNVLILEDDAIFCKNFKENFEKVNLPENWDMVYLGGQPLKEEKRFSDTLSVCDNINRTHAYAVNKNFVKILISCVEQPPNPRELHVDSLYGQIHHGFNVYLCNPRLIGQDAGISDINTKNRNLGVRFWGETVR